MRAWAQPHFESEKLAAEAELALRAGRDSKARQLYKSAGDFEKRALDLVPFSKARTRGIIAVSAVALYFKSGKYPVAEQIARAMLQQTDLPKFACRQLKKLESLAQHKLLEVPKKGEQ